MNRKSRRRSCKGCVCAEAEYPEGYLEKCRVALELALSKVEAYRPWRSFDSRDEDVLSRFAGLPVLDKAAMRAFGPKGFVQEGMDFEKALAKGEIELVKTSGSTGDMVENVWSQDWWNSSEKASWTLNSHAAKACSGSHREAVLASPLCVGFPSEDAYLSKEGRSLGRLLFLNERVDPSRWTESHMRRMAEELDSFAPAILEANPSYLARLCRFLAAEGLKLRTPKLIVFTYENPSALHLRQIAEVFDCPTASSYGSTEAGYVFMQCERGRFHQNIEHCHVDFIPFSEKHGGPRLGSLLATTLSNPWRSLLRFDIGDLAILSSSPCPCGRTQGLTLDSIEGRAVNLTFAEDGRAVTQAALDRALSKVEGLEDYQLLQSSQGSCLLRFCAESEIEPELKQALLEAYGPKSQVSFKKVKGNSPDHPGKYRLAKPESSFDARALWDPRFSPPSNTYGERHGDA